MSDRIVGQIVGWYHPPCGLPYIKDHHPTKPYMAMSRYSYYSKRYDKWVTVKRWRRSDGATGAFDIQSCSWWVHDELCDTGTWDDGTPLTNWQCSRVISDILWGEQRFFRSSYWLGATFICGGGKARANGMLRLRKGR